MKKYGDTIVDCKRIAYNPCALDEYEVTIKPYGEREHVICTFVSPFERDEDVCDRIYRQWLNDNSK